jgi:hypothetical protein
MNSRYYELKALLERERRRLHPNVKIIDDYEYKIKIMLARGVWL